MALPAGRYGVTKNQLLKIKKLPMNTIKLIEELTEKFDLLGTAAFKNSTSTVTESSDLVESGAVYDALGWGNKNLLDPNTLGLYDATGTSAYRYGFKPIALKAGTYTFSYGALAENVNAYITNITNNYAQLPVPTDTQALTFMLNVESIIFVRTSASQATTITNAQLEKGSTATAYEPYHASVSESLAEKCDNTVIAPVENGTTASQAYAVGEHFIRDGAFCTCKQVISQGGSFTLNTNYTAGDVADNLVYKAGDSITFDNLMFHLASCNNTGTTIYVYIPLNKPVVASSATSNFTTIVVRNGSSNYSESITVTDISIKSQGIFLGLGSTSAVGNKNSVLSVALVGTVTFS